MEVTLITERIRSFDKRTEIDIKPITFLVGENSSGKSTLLSALNALGEPAGFPFNTNFNRAPFNLGTFSTIATDSGGRAGRASSFILGFSLISGKRKNRVVATYVNSDGYPMVSSVHVINNSGSAKFDIVKNQLKVTFVVSDSQHAVVVGMPRREMTSSSAIINRLLQKMMSDSKSKKGRRRDDHAIGSLFQILTNGLNQYPRTSSLAPIRTKPKRTYEPGVKPYSAEGEHIPFRIARTFAEETPQEQDIALMEALSEFGKSAGMFDGISPRFLGSAKLANPFQLMVNTAGKKAVLTDVGYGVSQVLPVIVESITNKDSDYLLLQQPEVHLHPKAQAALGMLFAKLTAEQLIHPLIIETHSDYIIDRVRLAVSQGVLRPEQVTIVFLEKVGRFSQAHQLSLDDRGNILNTPLRYREFFMREQLQLLQRTVNV